MVGALFFLGIFFIPGIGKIVPWVAGLLAVGVAVFVAVKLVGKHNSRNSAGSSIDRNPFGASPLGAISTETIQFVASDKTLREKLQAIDGFHFEKLLTAIYKAKNYTVTRFGGANPDGGTNLMVENPATKFVVHCKQWKNRNVGVGQIREFLGTLTDSGVRKGVFVTLQGFSEEAKELAGKQGIELVDEQEIIKLLGKANWKYNPTILAALSVSEKRCSKSENRMILRTTKKRRMAGGKFWGCLSFPRCCWILTD